MTVVEKGSHVGGTTALSGGTTWIPAVEGGREEALAYLESLSHGLIEPAPAEAFVDTGPEFLAWVQARTPVGFHVVPGLPDYHPEHPGGKPKGGRSHDPDLFRVGALGGWSDRIVMPERTPRLMLTEVPLGGGDGTTAPGTPDRAQRKAEDWRGCGHALVGGLLSYLLDHGIEPHVGAGAAELLFRRHECGVRTDDAHERHIRPAAGPGRVAGVRLSTRPATRWPVPPGWSTAVRAGRSARPWCPATAQAATQRGSGRDRPTSQGVAGPRRARTACDAGGAPARSDPGRSSAGSAPPRSFGAGRRWSRVTRAQHDSRVDATSTDAALTLPGTLRRTATVASLTNPDAGVVTPDERAPWGRILTGAEALAARLAELGVEEGARVGLVAGNGVAGIEMLFACGMLNAACVPVNTRYTAPEIRHLLADAAVDTLVVTDEAELVAGAVPDLGADGPPDGLPALRRAVVVGADRPGFVRVDDDPGPSAPFRFAKPDDVALIVYTSGTTAHPRGCPLTHATLVEAGRAVGRGRFRCGPDDVLWDVLPLFHLSFVNPLLAILDAGGTFVTDRRVDAGRALHQIRDEGVTVAFTCFPTVMDALLAHPDFDECFAGVRLMLNVGTPETLRAIQSRAPRAIQLTSYGSSEMAGIAATTHPDDPDDVRLGTNGFPLPGIELTVVDPDTRGPLPTGEAGEVLARGTGMFTGYVGGEPHDRTAWFASGDLGLLDADGRVHYRGRLKDMVKVGGENVAALEIESVLAGHPGVRTVAVVPAPDPRYTEVPAAFVELHPGASASAEELQEHCAATLARFKVPRHIRFVTDWPMSSTKIRKGPLRERIAGELRGDP